ncbi:MAG: alpha/beta fold hydrolase [Chitinophagaceae bacterium]|nr:alpha/beta fold hydrolase [Chitinophagaceae bacterium]
MKLSCVAFIGSVLLLLAMPGRAQDKDSVVLKTATGDIYGTLTVPESKQPLPVALFIAGSGPTDRNGNNPMMKNNSLKFLGEALNAQGIATLRYDKRGIAASKNAMKNETDIRFNMMVDDAADLVKALKADKRFSKVIVVGHSEGSTIGLKAVSMAGADAMVSIAGPGKKADLVLREQLNASLDPSKGVSPEAAEQMRQSREIVNLYLDTLAKGDTLHDPVPSMSALFRPSVQPYLISWFKYDPQQLISALKVPVLIIQGNTDLQVKEEDATLLSKANPAAKLVIIDKMNHVLKHTELDQKANHATYFDANLPVAPELVTAIVSFIKGLK